MTQIKTTKRIESNISSVNTDNKFEDTINLFN